MFDFFKLNLNFDTDGDGIPDARADEVDLDGDGIPDGYAVDTDGDGIYDAVWQDTTGDGVFDTIMQDTDGDGLSDTMMQDTTGDGVFDTITQDTDGDGVYDTMMQDTTGDGIFDTMMRDTDGDGVYDTMMQDTTGDGIFDTITQDTDRDGIFDTIMQDTDGDGLYDTIMQDTTGDGIFDTIRQDTDGDGLFDTTMLDTDGDGIADIVMQDTDGDGLYDTTMMDLDGDGILDVVQGPGSGDDAEDEPVPSGDEEEELILPVVDVNESGHGRNYDELEQFDPSAVDPKNVIGTPGASMAEWEYQGNTGRCAIYAQKFIIEELTGQELDIEEMADIAEAHGWFTEEDGTWSSCINKLLEYYGVESKLSYGNDMEDLVECLQKGGKVIVSIDADEIWYGEEDDIYTPNDGSNHAVQVVGIDFSDRENPMVILNDSGSPDGCGEMIPYATFVDAWEDSGYRMVTCMG